MSFKDCIAFANENPRCYLATIDEKGLPRVRPMGQWFADEKGFYFSSHESKMLYKQVKNNNRVEVCYYKPDPDGSLGTVLRVSGEIEFLDDLQLKEKLLADRPFIKDMYGIRSARDAGPCIFRIHKGEAYFWTHDYNVREADIIKYKF
jgi:uncharacterized pyridoxamine 5'-phosphate oxidase family protein